MSIQSFLQNTFLDMWEMVARAVCDLEGVIGFEVSQLRRVKQLALSVRNDVGHE